MKQVSLSILLAAALSAGVVLAEPTTKPAAVPPPINAFKVDKDSLLVTQSSYNARYVVPKTWKVIHEYNSGGAFYAVLSPGKDGSQLATANVQFKVLDNANAPLADSVKEAKDEITKKEPEAKFIKDEATTLGGQPAWTVMYDIKPKPAPQGPMLPQPAAFAKKKYVPPVEPNVRHWEVYARHDDAFVKLAFEAPQPEFEMRSRMMKRVLESYAWVPGQPTVVQVDGMRMEIPPTWDRSADPQAGPKVQKFRHSRLDATLSVFASPAMSGGDWSVAAVEAAHKSTTDLQVSNPTFAMADTQLADAPAKTVVATYQYHSGCGHVGPAMKQFHTMALKDGKIYHLVLEVKADTYEKQKATLDQVASAIEWNNASSTALSAKR